MGVTLGEQQTYVDDRGRTVYQTAYPHIVKVPGVCGGRATIAGTRIAVWLVVEFHYYNSLSAEQMIEQWPHVNLAQIFSALAYYHDNKAEIDRDIYENSEEYVMEHYGHFFTRYPSESKPES